MYRMLYVMQNETQNFLKLCEVEDSPIVGFVSALAL